MLPDEDELLARAQARVGRVLKGKWRLDELVGYGGVAAVYAATHRNKNRVAVKVLHPELAMSTSLRSRFLQEGYVANAVGHPGAVQVLDDDVDDAGDVFLVMELLAGETLEQRTQRVGGQLPWEDVLVIANDVLSVIVAAHDKQILHRDLKPENIYLTQEGATKVLDFGLARIRELGRADRTQTRLGWTMGTPGYMPPEQLRGQWNQVDARADVWSLGATMFAVLSGRLVYDGVEPSVLVRPPRLRSLVPAVPEAVAAIVDRALSTLPSQRYQRAADMQAVIAALMPEDAGMPRSRRATLASPEAPSSPRAAIVSSVPPQRTPLDNLKPVEIAPSTYWVGKRDPQAIFHSNPYLRRFEGDQNLLVDPGSSSDFAVVSAKVGQLAGGMSGVTGLFINHQDPDVGSSASAISGRHAPDAAIYCSEATWRLIVHLNLPRDRFVDVDRHPRGFSFAGREPLIPVPSPFCHFRGAVMLYDPATRVLFSGDFMGGITEPTAQGLWADASDWSGIRAFHQAYMPTHRVIANTVRNIRNLGMPVDVIAPQHGRLLRGSLIDTFLDRMERLPVGLDLMDEVGEGADATAAWSSVLNRVLYTARMVLGEEAAAEIAHDEALADHVRFVGERAEVLSAGRWSISTAVQLLTKGRDPTPANAITIEALHACEELELPSPEVYLDRQGMAPVSAMI